MLHLLTCYEFQFAPQIHPPTEMHTQTPMPSKSMYYDATGAWPFKPVNLHDAEFRVHVARNLPSRQRANGLCEAYLRNISWLMKPINEEQLMDDLLPAVYGTDSFTGAGDWTEPYGYES